MCTDDSLQKLRRLKTSRSCATNETFSASMRLAVSFLRYLGVNGLWDYGRCINSKIASFNDKWDASNIARKRRSTRLAISGYSGRDLSDKMYFIRGNLDR